MTSITFLIALFIHNPSFADCLQERQAEGICPMTLNHIRALKDMRNCEGQQMGPQGCMEKVKASVSSDPAFTLLGVANVNSMSPQERQSLLKDFFTKNREEIRESIARVEFETRIKQPQLVSKAEVNGLIQDYRNHLVRVKANPNNADLKTDFAEFKMKNKDRLGVISRLYDSKKEVKDPSFYESFDKGGPKKIKFDVYKPMMVGGVDVANLNYEDARGLSDVIEDRDGKKYNTKTLFKNQADRVADELEKNLISGMNMDEALKSGQFKSWGYSSAKSRQLGIALKDVALAAQIEKGVDIPERTIKSSKYLKALKHSSKHTPRLKRIGMFSAGVAAAGAATVVQIMVENQAYCDSAFPYTPTSYSQPSVNGLGDESKCPMTMPKKGEALPQKVGAWLNGNEMDALIIMNSSTGGSSPCTYATRVYNNYFCDEKSELQKGNSGAAK